MAGLTLDAGALIAVDRGDRRAMSFLALAAHRGELPTIPASAITQAWRGGRQARLAQLLRSSHVEPADLELARTAGELLGRTRTEDVVDAQVAASAARRGDTILTTDPRDLQRLADDLGTVRILGLA